VSRIRPPMLKEIKLHDLWKKKRKVLEGILHKIHPYFVK
jgi:hypothetical protein